MSPVLYAEDSEDDAFLMRRTFQRVGVKSPLAIAPNGRKAVEYLAGAGEYADRVKHPLPALVLLDIKMPYESGLEVLKWIRQQDALRSLPVFMITSSSQEKDVRQAFLSGANGYLVKPASLDAFREMVEDLAAHATSAKDVSGWVTIRGGLPAPAVS